MTKFAEYLYPFIAAITFVVSTELFDLGGGLASLFAVLAMLCYGILSVAIAYVIAKKNDATNQQEESVKYEEPSTGQPRFCAQCGNKIAAGAHFCGGCGAAVHN